MMSLEDVYFLQGLDKSSSSLARSPPFLFETAFAGFILLKFVSLRRIYLKTRVLSASHSSLLIEIPLK